jgi:hypothetical protein
LSSAPISPVTTIAACSATCGMSHGIALGACPCFQPAPICRRLLQPEPRPWPRLTRPLRARYQAKAIHTGASQSLGGRSPAAAAP